MIANINTFRRDAFNRLSVILAMIGALTLALTLLQAPFGTSYANDDDASPDEAKSAATEKAPETQTDFAERITAAETNDQQFKIISEWIQDLNHRQEQIQKREKELKQKQQEILTLERDIERQAQQLQTLRDRLDQDFLMVDKARKKKLGQLVIVLNDKKTNADKAAKIFQQIDIRLAADILLQLDSKKAGEIISALDAEVTANMIAEMNRILKPDALTKP